MQFNSYIFILAFLPVFVLVYFLSARVNHTLRKLVVIAGSLVFYAYMNLTVLVVMAISLAVNLIFAKIINKTKSSIKIYVALPVIVNVLLLLFFKYTNFAISNINVLLGRQIDLLNLVLPVGISFFTFQQIAYVVAVYRKEINEINAIDYFSYILYFPKLLMGPLMDPVDFVEQYNDSKTGIVNWDNIAYGLKIFSFGLIKKVLLADTLAKVVSWGFENFDEATSLELLLVMFFYTSEIYFDFSGYTDMAVGVSQMLNITLPINFDSPYKAISIRDFWKRWHISLTKFLTKYIYIPLGGSKKGLFFTCLNTMIVFLVSGIWHGANWTFILWGLLHGLFSVFDRLTEKYTSKVFKPVRWLVTFTIVNVLWLLFRADSVGQWMNMLKTIVGFDNMMVSKDLISSFAFPESALLLNVFPFLTRIVSDFSGLILYVFTGVAAVICFLPENNYRNMRKLNWADMVFAAIFFVWGVTCLGSESVFVYFNF